MAIFCALAGSFFLVGLSLGKADFGRQVDFLGVHYENLGRHLPALGLAVMINPWLCL